MKDKKLFIIVIAIMALTILLSAYMIYTQLIMGNNSAKNEVSDVANTVDVDTGLSLTEVMNKINGYWHLENNSFWVVGFLAKDMTYTSFPYASEGGEGGKVTSVNHVDGDIYDLVVMLSPRLMCNEEFCEEGATIGQMSESKEITIKLDLSNIDNKVLITNDQKLLYLAATFDEIEKKIYN